MKAIDLSTTIRIKRTRIEVDDKEQWSRAKRVLSDNGFKQTTWALGEWQGYYERENKAFVIILNDVNNTHDQMLRLMHDNDEYIVENKQKDSPF